MKKTKEKDHYIKEIFKLNEAGEKVSVSALSKFFNVSKSSVSNMLKKLSLMELVDTSPYSSIKLTQKGRKFAKEVVAKHRLIGGNAGSLKVYGSSMKRDISASDEADRFKKLFQEKGIGAFKFRIGAELFREPDKHIGYL